MIMDKLSLQFLVSSLLLILALGHHPSSSSKTQNTISNWPSVKLQIDQLQSSTFYLNDKKCSMSLDCNQTEERSLHQCQHIITGKDALISISKETERLNHVETDERERRLFIIGWEKPLEVFLWKIMSNKARQKI